MTTIRHFQTSAAAYSLSKVAFIFITIGKKLLVTTYWVTAKGFAKQELVLYGIFASVQPAK